MLEKSVVEERDKVFSSRGNRQEDAKFCNTHGLDGLAFNNLVSLQKKADAIGQKDWFFNMAGNEVLPKIDNHTYQVLARKFKVWMTLTHIVWKLLKMSHFSSWHFPPFFILLKLTYLVTLFDSKLCVYKNFFLKTFLIKFCPLKM